MCLDPPNVLVNTARNRSPLRFAVALNRRVVVFVPVNDDADRFANVLPPSVLPCHCTVGVGPPDAFAVSVTVFPALTVVLLAGWSVTTGAPFTLSVKVCIALLPTPLAAVKCRG